MAYGRNFSFGSGPRGRPTVLAQLPKIVQHFNEAKGKMPNPSMRLLVNGVIFHISCASSGSANRGYLYVKRGGDYLGKIAPNGDYFSRELQHFSDALLQINHDPLAMAVLYGKETNSCSFCGRELSDARSVHFGYGPVCAATHGLPWDEEVPSNKHEELLMDLADIVQDTDEYELPALAVCSRELGELMTMKQIPIRPNELASVIVEEIRHIATSDSRTMAIAALLRSHHIIKE